MLPDSSQRRQAIREANELVTTDLSSVSGMFVLGCECGDPACAESLHVHEDDYRAARERPGSHLVSIEHVDPLEDRIVLHFQGVCATTRWPTPLTASVGALQVTG